MTPSTTIRIAEPEEFEAIGELILDVYVGEGHVRTGNQYVSDLSDTSARASAADVIVAVQDGVVVGSVTLARHGSKYAAIARPGEIEGRMLAVAKHARRHGLGQRLIQFAVETARAQGADSFVFTTRPTMVEAHQVYNRMGFLRAPDRDWFDTDGTPLTVMGMNLKATGADFRRTVTSVR
ncbi:GNAT family N-acetyltransferase [Mycolicibacterium farcinogenes]|nr:GNAT family N-acetyltransferase [Mycolicibacterium farcinogenes]